MVPLSIVVLRLAGLDYWRFWDAASVTMLVGLAVTRVGCTLNGCCVGRPSAGRWAVVLPDVHGRWERRVPTQWIEMAFAVLALAVVVVAEPFLDADGVIFAAVVGTYTLGRIATRSLRAQVTAPAASLTGPRSPP